MDSSYILAFIAAGLPTAQQRELRGLICCGTSLCEETIDELPQPLCNIFKDSAQIDTAVRSLEPWLAAGGGITILCATDYPKRLAAIPDPPWLLFYQGSPICRISEKPCIAVVGSRGADIESCGFAASISAALADAGGCVVSGLALGIDGAAHEGALRSPADLPTAAVLGNGLNRIYPAHHERLAANILGSAGLLISEFKPDEKPYPANFLQRNRIISGLSDGVIVIQAAKRSGALATARFALEQGREVLAAPGRPTDPRFVGSNQLIKEGACMVTDIDDLVELCPAICSLKNNVGSKQNSPALCAAQAALVAELESRSKLTISELEDLTPAPDNLSQDLLELELLGVVKRLPGNIITLCTER